MPHKVKVEAKDVTQAIEKGLKQLGLRRDQAEVKVLENPRKGFLGIGARPAVVEVRQKRWVSGNLDAQIYMDVPKKKRSNNRNGKGGNRRNRKDSGVKEIKRGGRRAYGSRRADYAPRENEPQLLPAQSIQNAVVPEFLKEPMQQAQEFVSKVLEHMGVKTENLHTWWDEKQNRILITLDCDSPAILIGKEGKTLESLQYLVTLSISRHFDKPISVIIDTQNYWRKAEDKINADLEYGINQIKKGYSVYRFRPMSAQLRRYIHRAAENNEFVITVSEGEAEYRKVTLRPRPADQPVQKTVENTSTAANELAANVPSSEETATSQTAAPVESAPALETPVQTEQTAPVQMPVPTPDTQVPATPVATPEAAAVTTSEVAPAVDTQTEENK